MTKEKSTTGGEVEALADALAYFNEFVHDTQQRSEPFYIRQEEAHHLRTLMKAARPSITGDTSDGYHTFNELYAHRHALFIALMKCHKDKSWRSLLHSDGTMFAGWFIAGINTPDGQATYHMPMSVWETTEGIETLRTAPEWDGHMPADVITRIGHLKTTAQPKLAIDYSCMKTMVEDEKGVDLEGLEADIKKLIEVTEPDQMRDEYRLPIERIIAAARGHLATGKGGDEPPTYTPSEYKDERICTCCSASDPNKCSRPAKHTPQPSPQSNMVAVPREVLVDTVIALKGSEQEMISSLATTTKWGPSEIVDYPTVKRVSEALSMLQPYTKGRGG